MFWQHLSAWFVGLSYGSVQLAAVLLLQSTVLISLGLAAGRLVRSRGAALQSAVYRTTLVALILCPAASLLLERAGVRGLAAVLPRVVTHPEDAPLSASESQEHAAATDPAPVSASDFGWSSDGLAVVDDLAISGGTVTPAAPADGFVVDDGADASAVPVVHDLPPGPAVVPSADAAPTAASQRAPTGLLVCLLTAIWLLGSCFLLARLLRACLAMMRLGRTACEAGSATLAECQAVAQRLGVRPPRVRRSPFVSSPCLIGPFRPTVLLPEHDPTGGDSEREILVHEIAHLVRRDHLWNLVGRVSVAMLFFQPLLWLLVRRIVRAAEEVCDDYVVDFGLDRRDYARRLVEIAERLQPHASAAAVGMISLRSLLGRRILRILDGSRRLCLRAGFRATATIVLVGVAGTLLVALLAVGGEPSDAPTDGRTAGRTVQPKSVDSEGDSRPLAESRPADPQPKPADKAAQQDGTEAKLTDVWREREKKVRSCRFEWVETRTIMKRSLPRPGRGFYPLQDVVHQLVHTLTLDGDKMRYSREGPDINADAGVFYENQRYVSTFDGGESRSFYGTVDDGRSTYPLGFPRKAFHHEDVGNPDTAAILRSFRTTHATMGISGPENAFPLDLASVEPKKSDLGERRCVVLRLRTRSGGTERSYWLDEGRGFLVLREVIDIKGYGRHQLDIDYEQNARWGWIPVRWEHTRWSGEPNARVLLNSKSRVIKYEINPRVPIEEFRFEFPAGTYLRGQGEDDYIVRADGTRRIVTSAERTRGVTYEELLETETGGKPIGNAVR